MQEIEHRILPEIWGLLIDAKMRVRELTPPMFDVQDLDGMSESELEEFFETTLLSNAQRIKIRESVNKLDTYKKELYPMRVRVAESACVAIHEVILKNKIFLPTKFTSSFEDILQKLWDIVNEYANQTVNMDRKIELWNQQCRIGKEIDELGSTLHDRFVELGAIKS